MRWLKVRKMIKVICSECGYYENYPDGTRCSALPEVCPQCFGVMKCMSEVSVINTVQLTPELVDKLLDSSYDIAEKILDISKTVRKAINNIAGKNEE